MRIASPERTISAPRSSSSTIYLQSFPRYLRRRISRTQNFWRAERVSQQERQKQKKQRQAGRQAGVGELRAETETATVRETVHPRYRSRRRGNTAAITDIVAARNGGEWARVNFPWTPHHRWLRAVVSPTGRQLNVAFRCSNTQHC